VSALPLVHPTVVHMLADAAARVPDHFALICDDVALTYAEYLRCVAALARELIAAGAGGERVAIVMGNSNEAAIAIFAAHAAGAQAVPLNPAYTASELGPILADAAPRVIIADAGLETVLATLIDPQQARVVVVQRDSATNRWGNHKETSLPPLPAPNDLATLQYTGGTTGRAKGVSLTHRATAVNISQREAMLSTRPEQECVLAVTPLFHVYAISMCLHLAAYARSTLVILPQYRPELALAALARHRITLLAGSPTIFHGLLAHPGFGDADFSSLVLCSSGASPLPTATLARWEEATGCPICEGFGQTEAGPVISFNPRQGVRKPGTVGLPLPATEVEIVDVETGKRRLPVGEPGEIRVRGPQLMQGYRDRPAETAEALRDGWLYTGDIGVLDADGYLAIRDRKKDMVIVSGFNVYPREVEDVLYRHPSVAEAVVIGEPDARKGERLYALVVSRAGVDPGASDLAAWCAQHLIRYKIPSEFRFVSELPKTVVGKIDRKRLKVPS
jgi:long-chain acyl-CoA synthetase